MKDNGQNVACEAKQANPRPQLVILKHDLADQGIILTNILSKAADVERALYGNVATTSIEEFFKPRPGEDVAEKFPGHMPIIFRQSEENNRSLQALSQFLDSLIDGLTGNDN